MSAHCRICGEQMRPENRPGYLHVSGADWTQCRLEAATPRYSLRYFRNADEARTYRHQYSTGGWIFEPETGDAVLFPPCMSPAEIFNHPAVSGREGHLIGSA